MQILGSNLQEIYTAIYSQWLINPTDKEKDPLKLVASVFTNRIYDPVSPWGRIWRLFYLFTTNSYKEKRLKEALEKTYAIYQEQLPKIEENIQQYKKYLAQSVSEEGSQNSNTVDEARASIRKWNQATLPFLKLTEQYAKEIAIIFSKDNIELPVLKYCIRYQHIIDLEGLIGGQLPLKSLAHACHSEENLKEDDKKPLRRLVTKIHHHREFSPKGQIQIVFRDGLQSLLNEFYPDIPPNDFAGRLTSLEVALQMIGCNHNSKECKKFQCHPYLKTDENHLKWRASLRPGDKLSCNSKIIELGEQLGAKPNDQKDNVLVFDVKNLADRVVLIGKNRIILEYMKHQSENPYLIEIVQIHEVDESGRIALAEKLPFPLSDLPWESSGTMMEVEIKSSSSFVTLLKRIVDFPSQMPTQDRKSVV